MKYFVGVDGGGSGCRVVLTSAKGTILSRASGGPANIETSFVTAKENIIESCKLALNLAKIPEEEISNCHAVLGLAGSNLGNYAKELTQELPFAKNLILNDGEITLEGAIGPSDGCIGALGTGSIFVGRKEGKVSLTGGWGFNLGDDGSGAKLGKELMRMSIKCHDGLEKHTKLTEKLLAEFQNDISKLVEKAKGFGPKDYAYYAPQIFSALSAGDQIAKKIVFEEVLNIEKSLLAAGFSPSKPFCLIGGLGKLFLPHLAEVFRKAVREPKGDALTGAISIAFKEYA